MQLANLVRGNDLGAITMRMLLSVVMIAASAGVGFVAFMQPAQAALAAGSICHSTAANTNPYRVAPPDFSAQAGGHADDDGPIWYHGIQEAWGDIIPPFSYDVNGVPTTFDGLNWGTSGQEIWNNDCQAVYPDLAIVKTGPATANEGGTGTYTLNVSNVGNGTAFASLADPVVVRDTMPSGVVATAWSGVGWSCTIAALGASVTCQRTTNLSPGDAAGPIAVTVSWNATGVKLNTATVDVVQGEKVVSNNTSTLSTTVAGPLLSGTVVKTSDADGNGSWSADETTSGAGTSVTFRATVKNTSGVTVSLGALSDNYGAAPGTTITPSCLATKPATLDDDEEFTCEFTVPSYTGPAGGSVSNTFSATLSKVGSSSVTPTGSAVVRTGPTLSGTVVKTSDADGNGSWTADETTSVAGTSVTFRATVKNTSGVTVSLGVLSDNYGAAPGTTITPSCLATKPATLDDDEEFTCEFTVPSYTGPAGGSVSNTFSATLSKAGSNSTTPTGSAIVRTSAPDLQLTKSGPATRVTGQTGNYALLVENVGPAPATAQISVTDTLPAGVTVTGPVNSGGFACAVVTDVVTCVTDDDLASGASRTITLPATFATSGVKVNTASVSVLGDDKAANNTSAVTTVVSDPDLPPIVLPTPPDLAIKVTGPAAVHPGDAVTWTLTVTNKGPTSASAFTVTDAVTRGVSLDTLTGAGFVCSMLSTACTHAGTLAAGSTATITATGVVADGTDPETSAALRLLGHAVLPTTISNTAVVSPTDITPADNIDTLVTAVRQPQEQSAPADLVLEKTAQADPAVRGGTLAWTITVINAGGSDAPSFEVHDTLGDGLTFVAAEGEGFSCSVSSPSCTYDGALSAGERATLVVTTTLDDDWASSAVVNSAEALLEGDPTPENNSDSATAGVMLPIGGGSVDPGSGPTPDPAPSEEPAPAASPTPSQAPFADEDEEPVVTARALPFTGSGTDLLLGLGAGLSVVGLMLALTGRRRRTVQ